MQEVRGETAHSGTVFHRLSLSQPLETSRVTRTTKPGHLDPD
jgi:hypothetical protein